MSSYNVKYYRNPDTPATVKPEPNTAWTSTWSNNAYSQNITSYQQQGFSYQPYQSIQSHASSFTLKQPEKPRTPSPPPPPPKVYRHWDTALKDFLSAVGLTQALRGFEMDMLVLNEDWEKRVVAQALDNFIEQVQKIRAGEEPQLSLEERKLGHVNTSPGVLPRSQSSINKSISLFLAQSRARNDASNRAEFVESIAEKRRRLDDDLMDDETTCARADAKTLDRDTQVKYDIAKNEDGPLRRTMRKRSETTLPTPSKGKGKQKIQPAKMDSPFKSEPGNDDDLLRHPGLDERLSNIETHFSVRYVPTPPRNLLARLKFLEDHIIKLEKDYPPWAALHFNQPNRGWPPPPRSTPIIVPPHLLSSTQTSSSGGNKGKKSSLHRAVMERLEVQQAKTELSQVGSR